MTNDAMNATNASNAPTAMLGLDVIDLEHFRIRNEDSERVIGRARRHSGLVCALDPVEDDPRNAARAWAIAEASVKTDRSVVRSRAIDLEHTRPGYLRGRLGCTPFVAGTSVGDSAVLALVILGGGAP